MRLLSLDLKPEKNSRLAWVSLLLERSMAVTSGMWSVMTVRTLFITLDLQRGA